MHIETLELLNGMMAGGRLFITAPVRNAVKALYFAYQDRDRDAGDLRLEVKRLKGEIAARDNEIRLLNDTIQYLGETYRGVQQQLDDAGAEMVEAMAHVERLFGVIRQVKDVTSGALKQETQNV